MATVRCFCLRVGDYQNCSCPDRSSCECANNCAPPKKKSLSLNHRWKGKESCADGSGNKENDARFQFLTEEEFSKLQEGYKPVNTAKCTKWAVNNNRNLFILPLLQQRLILPWRRQSYTNPSIRNCYNIIDLCLL